jgi:Nucleotide modification associated domain 2
MKTGEKVKRGATPDAKHEFKVFSYVVQHDTGYAPNPYFGVCTLCRCKFRRSRTNSKNIVELADVGDWILGTGGAA